MEIKELLENTLTTGMVNYETGSIILEEYFKAVKREYTDKDITDILNIVMREDAKVKWFDMVFKICDSLEYTVVIWQSVPIVTDQYGNELRRPIRYFLYDRERFTRDGETS